MDTFLLIYLSRSLFIFQSIVFDISNIFLQSFASKPRVFASVKYTRSTKPNDAMYLWLENVNSGGFEVCLREFLPFDGKHQDAVVVSEEKCPRNYSIDENKQTNKKTWPATLRQPGNPINQNVFDAIKVSVVSHVSHAVISC